jgi:hypothetical protein
MVIHALTFIALSDACASLAIRPEPPSAKEKVKPLALAKNVRRFIEVVCWIVVMS